MLTRYYTDDITDLPVSARQAWRFFSQVDDWSDWCSVVRHAKRFHSDWKKGSLFLFVIDLPNLPPAPLVVRILDVTPEKTLEWGVKTPLGSVRHRYTFIDLGDGNSRIHQEEWSSGAATLLMFPLGGLVTRFNEMMAKELEGMF